MHNARMHRILPGQAHPLFNTAGTRRIEEASATTLPAHTLMQRAGLQVARLSIALAPHAQTIWIACGPGNNGGDGIEAALHLKHWGKNPVVTWLGDEGRAPGDALASLRRARDAGVAFITTPPDAFDLCIDALLGIGATREPEGQMVEWIECINSAGKPVLAVDVPSGLDANTGVAPGSVVRASQTLALLTLKPGLFTGQGRDCAGEIWFDDLACLPSAKELPAARLATAPHARTRPHASHKGSWGDVCIIGGAPGMTGAALLAATAALHGGAGRVFVGLLDSGVMTIDSAQPELMLRAADTLDCSRATAVCGCGGGDAVRALLPRVLSTAARLVLDADALNAIAADEQLQSQLIARSGRDRPTVITPHPLEAARLLGSTTAQVQADRLAAAAELASRFKCIAVLKGSGTVIAAPDETSAINTTGNARLATAGTGDVLAGMIGAALAGAATNAITPFQAACNAVYNHGQAADQWPANQALTASALARAITP